jgi:hypothetical protein
MADQPEETPTPPTRPQDREFIAELYRLGELARPATTEPDPPRER